MYLTNCSNINHVIKYYNKNIYVYIIHTTINFYVYQEVKFRLVLKVYVSINCDYYNILSLEHINTILQFSAYTLHLTIIYAIHHSMYLILYVEYFPKVYLMNLRQRKLYVYINKYVIE